MLAQSMIGNGLLNAQACMRTCIGYALVRIDADVCGPFGVVHSSVVWGQAFVHVLCSFETEGKGGCEFKPTIGHIPRCGFVGPLPDIGQGSDRSTSCALGTSHPSPGSPRHRFDHHPRR